VPRKMSIGSITNRVGRDPDRHKRRE